MPMHSYTRDVIAFVKAHEGEWIDAIRFEQFGRQAWRTRISNARVILESAGEGTIENRILRVGPAKRSQYRFVRTVREPEQLTLDEARA